MTQFLKNLTAIQWFGIVILFNSVLLGGASQLGDLLIPALGVKAILAFATLANGFLGGLVSMFGTAGSMIRTVSDFNGVERITVNASATDGVAAAAIDPQQRKIGGATPDIQATLKDKASAA